MDYNFFDVLQLQLGKMKKYNYSCHIISHLSYFEIFKWNILTKYKKKTIHNFSITILFSDKYNVH